MERFEAGDIVRVPFPYTDRSTRQHRPALVVSTHPVGEAKSLIWVVMITSAENRAWPDDIGLGASFSSAGLPAPSSVRPCKIATIDTRHAQRLGRLTPELMTKVTAAVRKYVGL